MRWSASATGGGPPRAPPDPPPRRGAGRVPAIGLAKQLIEQGRLGQIREIRAQYLQDWLADAEAPMTWRLDKSLAGSGALGDIGAHVIDLAQHLSGSNLTAVSG